MLRSLRLERICTVLGLLFMISCGGSGGGCNGMTSIKGGYPVDKRMDSAISLRMSKGLFDFLEANGAVIVSKFLPPDGIPIPPSCGGDTEICCGQTCKVIPEFTGLTFTPAPPSTMTVTARTKLRTSPDFKVKFKVPIIGSVSCTISIDSTRKGKPDLGLTLPMVSTVNPETKLTSIDFDTDKVDILDLDTGDLAINGGVTCDVADFLKGLFIGKLKDAIKGQLAAPLQGALCQKCTTKDDCSSLADQGCDAGKKVCMRKGTCMQHLGIEGRMDLGAIGGGMPNGTTMDLFMVAGSYADVEAAPTSGLSLGVLGGSQTLAVSPCVPPRPAPSPAVPLKKTAAFAGNNAPNGKPFHIGAGLSTLELDSLGHSFYNTGTLCLAIGTEQVSLLSSSLFSVLVPSLAELTRGQNAALQIAIRPQYPPTFVLGKGTFKTDAMGKKVIDDPLLRLQIKGLALDFYVYMDERMVRFMRHTADIDVPLALDVDGMGQIVPILGDLSGALSNVKVTDSALLAESTDQLKGLLPSLLPTLLGSLGSSIKPIKLPELYGYKLVPVQFASTPDPSGKLGYLGLFLALAPGMPIMPLGDTAPSVDTTTPVKTYADLIGLEVPSQNALRNGQSVRATLQLNAERVNGVAEWQYRVDNGLWYPFDDKNQVTVDDPGLRLAGNHTIEVRARNSGSPYSLDPNPARVSFLVAPAADEANSASKSSNSTVSAQGCEMTLGHGRGGFGAIALLVVSVLSLLGLRRRRPARSTLIGAGVVALISSAGCSNDPMMGPGGDDGRTTPHPELNPIDEIGRYQSAVVRDGKIYISAYDSTMGDLAFATVGFDEAPTAMLGWLPVDGLPTGDPQNMNKDAWRGGYEDAADDVGRFTSLGLSQSGNPVVAYQDVTNNTVKLAQKDAQAMTWKTSVLTGGSEGKLVGDYTTMVLGSDDVPTVAYRVHGVRKTDGSLTSQLMVARAGSATPTGEDAWTRTMVAEAPVSCEGLCETGEACIYADPMKKDRLATVCKKPDTDCATSCKMGTACRAKTCVDALGNMPTANEPEGTGLYAQLLASSDTTYLLFYDHNSGALKVASGSDWKVATIDGGDGKVNAGKGLSAAIGTDGTLHVAYGDANHRVLYRQFKGGMPAGASELVDDGNRTVGTTPESHWVGGAFSLFLDNDSPVIAYQDQTAGSLEAGRKSGATWTHGTISPGGDKSRGYYPQAVSKDGRWLVLDVVYDRAATALSTTAFSPL